MQRKFIPNKGTQAARPERAEALGAGLQPVHKPLAKLE